ncbi:MAG: radical SAM protein [Nitrospirota bacterium]
MLEVSQRILNEGIEINWWCMARLDNGFNRRVFELAAKAGLKKINFGFESASDRICELLNKGNKKGRSSRIIRDYSKAGIEVDLQTMLGLPQETFDDGLETVDFLVTHKEFISHVTFNIYYLTPANFIYQEPQRYGIEYERETSLPFRFFYSL